MQITSSGSSSYTPPSSQASVDPAAAAKARADKAVNDFMAWQTMTPAQKMRAEILGSMKLTEADIMAMDEKERAKVEAKIKALIEQKVQQAVEKKTGVVVDLKA